MLLLEQKELDKIAYQLLDAISAIQNSFVEIDYGESVTSTTTGIRQYDTDFNTYEGVTEYGLKQINKILCMHNTHYICTNYTFFEKPHFQINYDGSEYYFAITINKNGITINREDISYVHK